MRRIRARQICVVQIGMTQKGVLQIRFRQFLRRSVSPSSDSLPKSSLPSFLRTSGPLPPDSRPSNLRPSGRCNKDDLPQVRSRQICVRKTSSLGDRVFHIRLRSDSLPKSSLPSFLRTSDSLPPDSLPPDSRRSGRQLSGRRNKDRYSAGSLQTDLRTQD